MASASQLSELILKPGREKALKRRHPWIFSGAIESVKGNPDGGELVAVLSTHGEFLGLGGFSPQSQIRCRMWTFDNELPPDPEAAIHDLIHTRLREAATKRRSDPQLVDTNAFRLAHAESDLLPGLIVDVYGRVAAVQFLSYGAENWREVILQAIEENLQLEAIVERSDADVRELEGLDQRSGFLKGASNQFQPKIKENGIEYLVDLSEGHKTGFYLDQRDNRAKLREFCSEKTVLDCFSYTGGFSLNALAGGAQAVTAVDTAEGALELLKENTELNNFDPARLEVIPNDVFKQLRLFRDQGRSFDVIVLDPPKFAPTRQQVKRAARGYKDINLLAAKLLNPGGVLFTFSCSGGVDAQLFQQIVAGAALDAEADLQVIGRMSQASDHPVLLSFPEGEYLKGLVCLRMN